MLPTRIAARLVCSSQPSRVVAAVTTASASSASGSTLKSLPCQRQTPNRRAYSSAPSPSELFGARKARRPTLPLSSAAPGLAFVGLSQRRNLSLWPSSKKDEVQSSLESAKEEVEAVTEGLQTQASNATHQISEKASDVAAQTNSATASAGDAVHDAAQTLSSEANHLADEASQAAAQSSSDLTSLGLGVQGESYFPVRYAQELLNFAVETTGLPWWATIALLTISIRLLVAPVLIWAQSNGIRMANIQPQMQAGMKELQEAKSVGDQAEMQRAALKVRKLMKDNDVSILRNFAVPAIQMPVFITLFFALRGMANAGLPSMQTGGLAWFTDLTTHDPYIVLPLVSAVMTLGIVESGAETGGTTAMSGAVKNFIRVLIVASLFFMYKFPAAVFVFWTVNNTFSLLQLLFLRTNFARRVFKVPARIAPPKSATPPQSFMDSVRAGYNSQVTPAPASAVSARTVAASRDEALRKLAGGEAAGSDVRGPYRGVAIAAVEKVSQGKHKGQNRAQSKAAKLTAHESSAATLAHKRRKEDRLHNARSRRMGGKA